MKHTFRGVCCTTTTLLLALAGSSLTSACSGYYPLGDVSRGEQPLDDSIPQPPAPQTPLEAGVPAPDFTISIDGYTRPDTLVSVGDLDGDGRDEMAVASDDSIADVVSVHLRYGGPRPADEIEALEFDRSGAVLALDNVDNAVTLAGAGDVDGDGYGDLLIRTDECTVSVDGTGAYLVYGGPERLQGVLRLTEVATHFVPPLRTANTDNGVGCGNPGQPSAAGDLDGDGLDDFVIMSAPQYLTDGSRISGTGEGAYIFYGSAQRFTGEVPLISADVVFHYQPQTGATPLGDVNGDGLQDLLMMVGPYYTPDSYFVPGREQRWSGTLELESNATSLGHVFPHAAQLLRKIGDLDGDGLSDVLLEGGDYVTHLFYGAPGLFEAGFDFSQPDAVLQRTANTGGRVYPVGDRDGDGDDELIDLFGVPEGPVPQYTKELAVSAGSRQRFSGGFSFPESEVLAQSGGIRFPENPDRCLDFAIPAGDLDGDGAADLFTVSQVVEVRRRSSSNSSANISSPQIHIHYGQPAPRPTPPLR